MGGKVEVRWVEVGVPCPARRGLWGRVGLSGNWSLSCSEKLLWESELGVFRTRFSISADKMIIATEPEGWTLYITACVHHHSRKGMGGTSVNWVRGR